MDLLSALTESGIRNGEHLFRKLMLQVSVIAAFIHVAFSFLFLSNDIWLLGVVNVFSVVLYLLVFVMILRRQHTFTAWVLVVLEILGHAALAVYFLGWDSGFHFYAMVIPPVVMISPLKDGIAKMPVVMGMMMLYILMDYLLRHAGPLYLLPQAVLNTLYYFNLLTVLFVMVFLSGLYYRLVMQNEAKLQQLATTDSLTGLQNRRSLTTDAEREIANHKRSGSGLSLLLCDLDNFKRVNDLFGHQAGDRVLMHFAQVLVNQVRSGDLAARWGGEEFLLVLPNTPMTEAQRVAERIRDSLAQSAIQFGEHEIRTSTTIGVSELAADDSFEQLVARADEAMYRGKEAGRNCIMLQQN